MIWPRGDESKHGNGSQSSHPPRNPNSYVHHNALLMKQPQPMVKYNQGKLFNSSFHAYLNLFECPQSSIHQDMRFGLEKLISQFI